MFGQYPQQYPYPWNGFVPYQPQQQNLIQGVRFVDGLEEAKNCTTPLGTKALLMDKNRDRFYIKETDLAGVSSVTEFEFRKVVPETPKEYVTRQELDELKESYESAIRELKQSQSIDKPSFSNGSTYAIHQDNLARTGEGTSGAAYQTTGNHAARI